MLVRSYSESRGVGKFSSACSTVSDVELEEHAYLSAEMDTFIS
jgi:hypothetical protein